VKKEGRGVWLTLGPGETQFISSAAYAEGYGYGDMEVIHGGEPGTIIGSQTTLSPTTGLSFDSPLLTRSRW